MGEAGLRAAGLALLLALAACGELDQPVNYPPRAAPAMPERPVSSPPMRSPAPAARVEQPPADACGAAAHQHLVGKNRSEIPVPVNPAQRRVACTTCPVTEEYSAWRLNFFYDAQTGLITEVRCG